MRNHRGNRIRRARQNAALVLVAASALAGCDSLLEVEVPGDLTEEALQSPSMANLLVVSTQNDWECALADKITWDGLWTGTLNNASTHNPLGGPRTRRPTADGGSSPCPTTEVRGNSFAPYGKLQIARGQARTAYEIISGHESLANKELLLARAAAYQGYATLLLIEGYCEMRLDPEGERLTPAQGADAAAALFATARTHAAAAGTSAAATAVLNLARVGGARALAFRGQLAEAKTLAAQVPANFVFNATFDASTPRRHNKVYSENDPNGHTSVHPSFHTNNPADPQLRVDGVLDPRVPVFRNTARGANDGVTPMWTNRLYTSHASPIPMAKWQEAQLIIAEAELAANNVPLAVAAINAVRTFYQLPQYAGGSAAEVRTQLIEERRREFFLQGHRLGDMLRFNQPFEEGEDPKGQPFTTGSTCIQFPQAEL